jgi:hypothetical protein
LTDEQFVISMKEYIIGSTPTTSPLYVIGKRDTQQWGASFEHLACFLPGTLALGNKYLNGTSARPSWELELAKALTASCYAAYHIAPSGLGADELYLPHCAPTFQPDKNATTWHADGERNVSAWKMLAERDLMAPQLTGKVDTEEYLSKKVEYTSPNYFLRPGWWWWSISEDSVNIFPWE